MRRVLLAVFALFLVASPALAIDFQQALAIAQEKVPNGQLIRGRTEGATGAAAWFGMYFLVVPKTIFEVEVSQRGDIIKIEERQLPEVFDETLVEAVRDRKGAKIPVFRFVELAAAKANGGKFKKVEMASSGGKIDIKVDFESGSGTTQVTVDPIKGKVTGVKGSK